MKILKVVSRLLDYPTQGLFDASSELCQIVRDTHELTLAQQDSLVSFIEGLCTRDLYDAQERYDLLFDRGRALSLLLFEHVHGESRDRGQAMVDLINVYRKTGFEVDSSQLPDYVPLYLEFLSEQPVDFTIEWLGDISHLMALLSERTVARKCDYSCLFDTLIALSGSEVDRKEISEKVQQEERDDTVEAIDKEWEDREIRFDEPVVGDCSSNGLNGGTQGLDPNNPQVPISWHDAATQNNDIKGL